MWQHFRSEAVHFLREKFTGFIRVPLADVPNFENWYDDLVAQQLLATTSGDRGRASFLSKKRTKVLRYALPQTFLEQFFHRHAARAAGAAVPDPATPLQSLFLRSLWLPRKTFHSSSQPTLLPL